MSKGGGIMRYVSVLFLVALLAMPSVGISAEKAKTVDELAKMYDSTGCKSCHAEIYSQWEKSIHSHSLFGTKRTMGGYKGMIEAGLFKAYSKLGVKEVKDIKVEHFAQCFKCHLPQIKDATDAVAQQLAKAFIEGDKATLLKVNINCVVCHNLKAIVHKWQDGEPEAGVIYGSKDADHPDGTYKKLKKSVIMGEALACGQCHGSGPNLEFPQPSQCATAYGSYQHAYIPSGGSETCQDCHMKKNNKGHMMPAYRDADMRKMAFDVNVDIESYKFLLKAGDAYPMSVVTVRMTNHAGHRVPDG
jgi:nitrate/TMAO reductase-like tetraheme cytochrome c subunit